MASDVDEKALFERFSKKYKLIQNDLLRHIERSNCGCDYGATSFTTLKQAGELNTMLALGAKQSLLEIGAGSGWPGLYLAKQSGCDITLTDLPIEGLQIARERGDSERLPGICRVAIASGSALPFRTGAFDAISHSDVLCCLIDKKSALKACRSVIDANGKMIFSVILISPGLTKAEYQRAMECGPSFMAAEDRYENLLDTAGWKLVNRTDLSEEFFETLRVMLGNELDHAEALDKLLGKEETLHRLTRTRSYIEGLELGLIRRELFQVVPI